jgi:hypothetical protein
MPGRRRPPRGACMRPGAHVDADAVVQLGVPNTGKGVAGDRSPWAAVDLRALPADPQESRAAAGSGPEVVAPVQVQPGWGVVLLGRAEKLCRARCPSTGKRARSCTSDSSRRPDSRADASRSGTTRSRGPRAVSPSKSPRGCIAIVSPTYSPRAGQMSPTLRSDAHALLIVRPGGRRNRRQRDHRIGAPGGHGGQRGALAPPRGRRGPRTGRRAGGE